GGVFLGLKSSTQTEADTLFNSCKPGCDSGQVARIKQLDQDVVTQRNVGFIGLGAGGLFLAGGIALFIIGGNKPAPKAASSFVLPYVAPNGGGVVGTF
ncbi:MAG TPA: hypothetical protein PKA58_23000, partial [Polyangium sp.]|nr:hypothetical protein [Polyangium sp.]